MFKNLFGSSKEKTGGIHWNTIDRTETLEEIKETSRHTKVLIFKHSTRCSISSSALSRLERSWNTEEMESIKPYFLDLISYRNISHQIAEEFGVEHQSPQLIIIEQGKPVYYTSHMGINYEDLKTFSAS